MGNHERELIEALLDGDGPRWKSAVVSLGNERAKYVQMMTLTNAVLKQFPGDVSVEEVAAYAKRLREHHLPGADLKLLPTEYVIRGILDEPELIKEVPGEDMVAAQLVITNAVANEHHLIGPPREVFIAEVLDALD